MTFNKNVVNMTVSGNNLECFSLYAADGSTVPVEVIMADDQIEPEKKNDITLKPLQGLKHDTAYSVKVSSALKAKSGATMAGDLTITFITAKDSTIPQPAVADTTTPQNTVDSPPPADIKTEIPVVTGEPQAAAVNKGDQGGAGTGGAALPGGSPATSTGGNSKDNGADSQAGETGIPGGSNESELPLGKQNAGLTWAIIIVGLALFAAAGYFISRRKK
jgi:LPXTG-motif cell wall-anchored protein